MKSFQAAILISTIIFLSAYHVSAQSGTYATPSIQPGAISLQSSTAVYNPSISRLWLQFGSGVVLGAAGGLLGGVGGFAANGFNDDFDAIGPVLLGTSIGYLTGGALGIYLVANSSSYDASFGYIILGNIVGAGVGIGGILLTENTFKGDAPKTLDVGLAFSSIIIGGIIANSLTIKKRSNQSSALFNISDSNSQLAIPSIKLTKTNHVNFDKMEMRNSYSPTIKLLNISL